MSNDISLPQAIVEKIIPWLQKFPKEHKRSGVIYALAVAQEYNQGWLSHELIKGVAAYLGLPFVQVYEVASFYSMFELHPVGKCKIEVCTNIPCMLNGCDEIVKHLESRIGPSKQVTKDGSCSWKKVECLGACDRAPYVLINGQPIPEATSKQIEQIMLEFKKHDAN